jgi:hypothetical protein
MVIGVVGLTIGQHSVTRDESDRQLRDVGKRVAAAVLNHDIETLLTYDSPDFRASDRVELQNNETQLSCFIFNGRCNDGHPSVYDILSRAKRLEVQVSRSKTDPRYSVLLFFDGTRIAKSRLRSPSYLCHHLDQLNSWLFRLENGAWVSAHSPFDAETDTLCSP